MVEHNERVREIRKLLNLTQEEFAHQVGVTVSTVNRWEKKKSTPHKVIMQKIESLVTTN